MRIEIKAEIDRSFAGGLAYTRYRRFYDPHERAGFERCACGRPSLVIAYCTLGIGVIALCHECLEREQEADARRLA